MKEDILPLLVDTKSMPDVEWRIKRLERRYRVARLVSHGLGVVGGLMIIGGFAAANMAGPPGRTQQSESINLKDLSTYPSGDLVLVGAVLCEAAIAGNVASNIKKENVRETVTKQIIANISPADIPLPRQSH